MVLPSILFRKLATISITDPGSVKPLQSEHRKDQETIHEPCESATREGISLIKGVGIDMVSIGEMSRYMKQFGASFVSRTFTNREVSASKLSPNPAEYLSTRFAAKEAVFKAVAHSTRSKQFDPRIVETLNDSDGYPVVQVNTRLQALLDEAGIEFLHVSMATEGDYATAIAVASSNH